MFHSASYIIHVNCKLQMLHTNALMSMFLQKLRMFTFDEMILFDKSAKAQVAKKIVNDISLDASSPSTQPKSSLAGSEGSSVDNRITSPKSKVPPTKPKISSNTLKTKVSSVGTSTSKLSKFVPPRRVAKVDSDQERKEILKELISLKPKQKNKQKLLIKHKVNASVGKKPSKKPEQVFHIEKCDDAKLVESHAVEPAEVFHTKVASLSVMTPEINQLVSTKSTPVEVLSVQSESIEFEDVDSSETKEIRVEAETTGANLVVSGSEMKPNNETKVYKCEKCQETFSYLKRYNDHERKGHCNMAVTCTQCGVAFGNAKNLKRHIHRIHEKPLFKCGNCGKIFPSEKTVNKHYISHHVPHMCDWCRKVYKNANTLRSHVSKCKKTTKVPLTSEIDRSENTAVIDASPEIARKDGANKDKEIPNSKPEGTETNSEQTKKNIPKPKTKLSIKECNQCGKKFESRSGYRKHMKTHEIVKGGKDNQEMIIMDENIVKAIEDMGEANFIVQENDVNEDGNNSHNVLLLVQSNE